MATYYVSWDHGNDANNGLGPDASHASNKPFKTLAKCIASGGSASSGDTIYICPGTQREVITIALAPSAETRIIGDVLNSQGFKTAGGVRVTPGEITISGYTTNDKTAPSNSSVIAATSKNYYSWQNVTFFTHGTNPAVFTTTCANWQFHDCCLIAYSHCLQSSSAALTALSFVVNRCRFISINGSSLYIQPATSASGNDWDISLSITNSFLITLTANAVIRIAPSGTNAKLPGGPIVYNCTIIGTTGMGHSSAYVSATYPTTVYNCLIYAGAIGLSANASPANAMIDGGRNCIYAPTALSNVAQNVTAGDETYIDRSIAPIINVGDEIKWLSFNRPFFSPKITSPLLGLDNTGTPPTDDILGLKRPSGPGITWGNRLNAVGCYEHHDFGTKETTIVDSAGASLKLLGPGDVERKLAVKYNTSTTISVKGYYDATHDATTKPQVVLIIPPEVVAGGSTETLTMSVAAGNWETLTFTGFTPAINGYVTLRFISRPNADGGACYFDTLSVA